MHSNRFGLVHLDEDFFNKDLGSCMDYTKNPGANKSPNEDNFKQLAEMYGRVVQRTRRSLRLEVQPGRELFLKIFTEAIDAFDKETISASRKSKDLKLVTVDLAEGLKAQFSMQLV